MAKITSKICEVCRQENCDGKKYQTEYMYGDYGLNVGVKIVCGNDPDVGLKDGKLMYKLVCGHGSINYYDLKEI